MILFFMWHKYMKTKLFLTSINPLHCAFLFLIKRINNTLKSCCLTAIVDIYYYTKYARYSIRQQK